MIKVQTETLESIEPLRESGGFCQRCQKVHMLAAGGAKERACELMKKLEQYKQLDFNQSDRWNPLFSTTSLFGKDRGKMFGVLEGLDRHGKNVVLYAFSGQFNGHWLIPGWAPPLFNHSQWQQENFATERAIKKLTVRINTMVENSEEQSRLKHQRKILSQQLMHRLHGLYSVKNFRGESAPLPSFYSSQRGAPTGAGDCCAPKLLNQAQIEHITPTGLAEFYWGRTNLSKSRIHGHFYPACTSKCTPLLGFMLCGVDQQHSSSGTFA